MNRPTPKLLTYLGLVYFLQPLPNRFYTYLRDRLALGLEQSLTVHHLEHFDSNCHQYEWENHLN